VPVPSISEVFSRYGEHQLSADEIRTVWLGRGQAGDCVGHGVQGKPSPVVDFFGKFSPESVSRSDPFGPDLIFD
jgi:hypothetical protein